MFRWYHEAAKCYVYLADVHDNRAQIDELPRSTWKLDFRRSRWFTRGWTLQELIAPSSVEFFSSEWQRLGDKKSLQQELYERTNVPVRALQGFLPDEFSVEERISWSKDRSTTRPEDKAYSMLGIMDVHVSPIYGEGGKEAFERLQIKTAMRSAFLDKLPVVEGASFDSFAEQHHPTCLQDARVDLLHEISEWIKDPQAKTIFWLNGVAGTGKSTISRTLARSTSESGSLGASFFFKRGEGDRGGVTKFVTTIASQLVTRVPNTTQHVKSVIDKDSVIASKAIREQFEKLILQPLAKMSKDVATASTLILVDALDECENDADVRLLINLFIRAQTLNSTRLRVFVTSRPELPIRLGFSDIDGTYQHLVLHEIRKQVMEHDISTYLKHELATVRSNYNRTMTQDRELPPDWPGQSSIQFLVTMAIPLFIFAATVCRFLTDRSCGDPDEQLQKVLAYQTKSQESKLDATYLPVLNQQLSDHTEKEKQKIIQEFRIVIGAIILFRESPFYRRSSTCAQYI